LDFSIILACNHAQRLVHALGMSLQGVMPDSAAASHLFVADSSVPCHPVLCSPQKRMPLTRAWPPQHHSTSSARQAPSSASSVAKLKQKATGLVQ
jgi:hypothetical protein